MKISTFIQHAQYALCTLAMLLTFVGTAWGDTTTTWNFSDGGWTAGTAKDGLTPGSDVTFGSSNKSIDGFTFTQTLKLGGTMSATKNVSFAVTGPCTIKVYGTSSSKGNTRYLKINSGSYDGTAVVTSFAENDGNAIGGYSCTYTGSAATLYLGSTNSGYNIYAIQVTYSSPATHSVTYALNGGEGTAPTQAAVAEGGSFTVAGIGSVTNSGYTFSGWNDGTSDYAAGATYTMGTSDVTLTAQWTAIPTYTVTYDVNGGTSATPTQDALYEGGTFTVASAPERADYTFNGWSDGTNIYAAGSTYTMGAANVTLTAQWESSTETKTVTLDGNGKTQTVTSLTEPSDGQGVVLPMGYTSATAVDCSSSEWKFADNVLNKGTYNSYFQEAYYEFSVPAGNVLWKEITGLTNGTYEVVLKVAASRAWFNNFPIGNGLTSAFANSSSVNIPVIDRTAVATDKANTIVLNASVTNGTLSVGIKNLQASANWYLASIESVKLIESSNFLAWYDEDGKYAGTAGDTYKPTQSTTLYAAWENHTVTTGTVGPADKSNNWWTYFSPNTTIKSGETYKFSFNNFGSTGQNFYNWILVAGDKDGHNGDFTFNDVNKYKEYVVLRADNYGWDDYYQAPTLTGDFDSYIAALESEYGAKVEMTVTFNGGLLCVNATTRANDSNGNPTGDTYYYSMTSKKIDADSVSVFHTTEQAYLTDYTVEKVATPTHTVYFDLNGGTGTAPTAITAAEGASVTMPSAPADIDMFGQTFYAWSPNGSDKYIPGSTTYTMGASDVTMGAQYYLTPTKSVNFDGNGKNIAATTLKEPISGQKIILPAAYSSATSITSNANWVFAADVKNNGTYSGITGQTYQEAYYYTPVGAGDVVTKTETGLANGTYEVIMSVGASWTRNNGVSGGITGNNLTYAFAQDKEISIPVIDRTWINSGEQNIVAFTVEVTDGTLKYGLKNTGTAGNWYIINIESLKKIDNSNFLGWYTAATDGTKVGGAGDEYAATGDETLYAQWQTTSYDAYVLEMRGTKGSKNGTFTNSTSTVDQALSNANNGYTNVISSLSANQDETTSTVYYSGGITTVTIGLNSSSASKIVIGGISIASEARGMASSSPILVNGEEVTGYTISGSFPAQTPMAFGTVTIDGLKIAQGDQVTFNFEGKVRVAYFEVTPVNGDIKSSNANLQSVTVHGMALSPVKDDDGNATANYIYKLGTGYESNTIDLVVTPSDNNASIGGRFGAQTINMGCGEPTATAITPTSKTVTVTAEDGSTKDYTITIYRVPVTTTSTNRFRVSDAMTYIEGMQCQTPDENHAIMATISTTYGYAEIPGVKKTNYANTTYNAYGLTENATAATYNESGIPTSGVYYRFDARVNGYIEMALKLDAGEQLKVVDASGNAVSYSSYFKSSEIDEVLLIDGSVSTDATGYIQFPVVADKQYYVYAPDAKLDFMGFYYSDKSSDATASFTLDGEALKFTNGGCEKTTTKLTGELCTVNITLTNASSSVTTVSNATATGNENEYSIIVPAGGSNTTAFFTITAEDGTTKSYTIRINKDRAATSRFHLTMTSTSDVTVKGNSNVELNDTYATVTGGTATLYNNTSDDAVLISKDQYTLLASSSHYINVALDGYTLQEGDVIIFKPQTNVASDEIRLSDGSVSSGNQYTIPANSSLIGLSSFNVSKNSSNTNIYDLEIITPLPTTDVAVKINNTTIAVTSNGNDGTSSKPKVFEYTVPAEFTGDLPVSLTTTGTLNGGFTSVASADLPVYGGSAVTKDFSVTANGSTMYYQIKLTRGVSTDCTLASATIPVTVSSEAVDITATIGDADSEGNIPVTATIPYNAVGTSFNVTLEYSSSATSSWNGTSISLAQDENATATQEFTITAQDGVTTKTYVLTLTRGTKDAYLVTENGQTLYMTKENLADCETTNGNFYTIITNKTTNTTYDSYKGTYSRTKYASEYAIVAEKGACSFTVSMNGGSGRTANIYVGTSENEVNTATDPTSTVTTTGSVKTSDIIKLDGTGVHYIKVAGTGDDMYLVKLTFNTKKSYTLAYSAESWDCTGTAPTLTATDEDGNDVSSKVEFVSDDETVATASASGIVVDEAANGSATITATLPETTDYTAATTEILVVKEQGYSYNMKDVGTKYTTADGYQEGSKNLYPNVQQKFYFKDEEGNDLTDILEGTFGGWMIRGEAVSYKTASSGNADKWSEVANVGDFSPVDGYNFNSGGNNNAKSENLTSSNYQEAETDAAGNVTTSPFSLPCRGTYMTFEPKVNGTLSVYILQNGAWDTDYTINEYNKHPFFFTDQNGRSIADYTEFSTTLKRKITTKYNCVLDAYGNAANDDPNNIGNWDKFKNDYSKDERLAIQAAWSSGANGTERVVVLDDGSFLLTEKACVKYTFYAIAGQTYYLFSNGSKLGFCGMNFVVDKNETSTPTAELDLSENIQYDADAISNDAEAKITGIANPQYKTITLDRTFKKDYWNTLCVPFGMTQQEVIDNFGEDAEIILLDNIEVSNGVGHLHFIYHEIQAIVPGYPYIIRPGKDNAEGIVVSNKIINPYTPLKVYNTTSGYASKGIDGYCTPHVTNNSYSGYSVHLKAGDIFLKSGYMYVCGNNSYLKGYRAYMEAPEESSSQAKSVIFDYRHSWEDEGEATQIDLSEFDPEALMSLGIVPDGVYNLNGQKIANTTNGLAKGIYIVNGKKMTIK